MVRLRDQQTTPRRVRRALSGRPRAVSCECGDRDPRGFCDPDGELVAVLDRPEWQRVDIGRKDEIVDEMVRVCEQRGLCEVEAWRRGGDGSPQQLIGYWHPRTTRRERG